MLVLLAAPLEAAGTTMSAAAYALGSFICHQQPDRSFHLGVAQLPVCARCFGLYAGAALGAALSVPVGAFTARLANHKGSRHTRMLLVSALPTLIAWTIEVLGLGHPSNVLRALAALPLGSAVAIVVVAALDGRLR